MRLRATNAPGADWTVRLSDAPPHTVRTAAEAGDDGPDNDKPADCTIEGPAEELYLALWNRLPWDALTITGDETLPRLWRERAGL